MFVRFRYLGRSAVAVFPRLQDAVAALGRGDDAVLRRLVQQTRASSTQDQVLKIRTTARAEQSRSATRAKT